MTDLVPAQNGCWIWRGTVRPNGYGSDGGRPAHTRAWGRLFGQVPRNHELHHTCGNRLCVNPSHLIAISAKQHRRLHASAITRCPQGHDYSEENTRFRPSGARVCRTCERIRARATSKRRYWSDPVYRASKIHGKKAA